MSLLCIFFKVVLSRLWRSPTGFRRGFSVLLRHNTPDRSLEQSCFAVCLLEINNKKLRCIVSPWRFITWRKVDLFCCGVFIFKSTDPPSLSFPKCKYIFNFPKTSDYRLCVSFFICFFLWMVQVASRPFVKYPLLFTAVCLGGRGINTKWRSS